MQDLKELNNALKYLSFLTFRNESSEEEYDEEEEKSSELKKRNHNDPVLLFLCSCLGN